MSSWVISDKFACVLFTQVLGLSGECVRSVLSSSIALSAPNELRMQQCKRQMVSPSLVYSSIPSSGVTSNSFEPLHIIQCAQLCVLELISRSNSNDIPPLQIKLFSSSVHLFYCCSPVPLFSVQGLTPSLPGQKEKNKKPVLTKALTQE